jgi:polysaccharide export outer membrane protein
MRVLVIAALVTAVGCGGALAQTRSTSTIQRPNAIARNLGDQPEDKSVDVQSAGEYVIGPEDVLSINVWKEQDLSTKVTVRPDGKIGLPLLNDIQASGFTPRQLQENITTELKKFINNPQVSVIVLEIHSQNVYVIGGIAKPGVYPLGSPTTVMELLVRAGGLTEFTKGEEIQVLRNENGKQVQYKFNFKAFSEGKDYKQNIRLRNGDMVIVR